MNSTELKEQIEAAKLRNENEKKLSFPIAPLNPDIRLVPVDCQVKSLGEKVKFVNCYY